MLIWCVIYIHSSSWVAVTDLRVYRAWPMINDSRAWQEQDSPIVASRLLISCEYYMIRPQHVLKRLG